MNSKEREERERERERERVLQFIYSSDSHRVGVEKEKRYNAEISSQRRDRDCLHLQYISF